MLRRPNREAVLVVVLAGKSWESEGLLGLLHLAAFSPSDWRVAASMGSPEFPQKMHQDWVY